MVNWLAELKELSRTEGKGAEIISLAEYRRKKNSRLPVGGEVAAIDASERRHAGSSDRFFNMLVESVEQAESRKHEEAERARNQIDPPTVV